MARNRWTRILAAFMVVVSLIAVATLTAVPAEPQEQPAAEPQLTPEEEAAYKRFVDRFRQGQRLMGGGKDKEAEAIFRELLEEHPDAGAVHHALGFVLRYANRPDEALASFVEAARLAPEDSVIQRDCGMLHLDLGHPKLAVPYLVKAQKLWPEDVEAAVALGTALRRTGRSDEAAAVLRAAIILEPNSVDAHVGLAAALLASKPEEAIEIVTPLNHNFFDVNHVHGLALMRLARYEEAAPLLAAGAAGAPPGPVGQVYLQAASEGLITCGDAERAVGAAARWCELDSGKDRGPGVRPAFALAQALAARGKHAEAVKALNSARPEKLPPALELHVAVFAAVEFHRTGKVEQAAKLLDRIAASEHDVFERAVARRLAGKLSADDFAKTGEGPGRANDVAWVESIVAEQAGDADAAKAHRAKARELSKPPGEYPGLLALEPPAPEPPKMPEAPEKD